MNMDPPSPKPSRHSAAAPSVASTCASQHSQSASHCSERDTRGEAGTAARTWLHPGRGAGGQRTEPKLGRGVVSSAGLGGGAQWREAVEVIIQHGFQNPDLLEEALESPGSGVTCVGSSHRHFGDGNKGLASVGEAVMRMVLRDQCYLFKIPDGDAANIMDRILSRSNLDRLGRLSKIERFVRPRLPMRPSKRTNVVALLKDDVRSEDPSRTISRAIKAIIAAVYYDAGLHAATRVMTELDLIIKLPG